MNRIEFIGNALFIPYFLIGVGMLINVRLLFQGGGIIWTVFCIVVFGTLGKAIAAYLAGFLADKYDVSSDAQLQTVNSRIRNSVEEAFRNTVTGYSSVTKEWSTVNIDNKLTKYALYPVWVLTTRWQDKPYIFAMNGQTGKFVGDLPVDKSLRAKLFAGISIVTAINLFLVLYFVF